MQEVTPENENQEVTETAMEETAEDTSTAEVVEGEIEFDEEDDDEADDELEEAQDRIEELEAENEQLRSRALRIQADMENYKKRTERERMDSIKFANKSVFLQLLDVLDNFDRALTAVTDPKDNFAIGVQMIQKQLLDVLSQNGVEEINAVGRQFDPYLDEALAQEPTSEHEENTIIEVFMKGYRYQGNLLRATKVKVAALPADASADGEAASDEETEIDTEA